MATLESFGCLRAEDHDLIMLCTGKHCTLDTNSTKLVILKINFLKQA